MNDEKIKLHFNGFNIKSYCWNHDPLIEYKKRNILQQIYYRRYAINFEDTSIFPTFDDFLKDNYEQRFLSK